MGCGAVGEGLMKEITCILSHKHKSISCSVKSQEYPFNFAVIDNEMD